MVERVSLVDILLDSEPSEEDRDLARALVAIDRRAAKTSHHIHNGTTVRAGEPTHNGAAMKVSDATQTIEVARPSSARPTGKSSRTSATRSALAITGLGGLFIAGVTVITTSGLGTTHTPTSPGGAGLAYVRPGDCLSWPKGAAEQAHLADCTGEHLFEVAQAVDVSDAQQGCQQAVERYLGTRYDPNGKFAVGAVPAGSGAGSQSGQHLLCGLLLPGADKQPVASRGKVAELDQSRVWPTGMCLASDPSSDLADVPVGCAAPHAEEITGVVNLREAWPAVPPSQADEDAFVRNACTRATDTYLSPVAFDTTGLTRVYNTVPMPSWLAGSRQVSCGIGAPLGERGWATLSGSAKDHVLINGVAQNARPAAPPPDAPDQRPDASSTAATPASPTPNATASRVPSTAASPSPSPSAAPSPSPAPPVNPSAAPTTTTDDTVQVFEIPGLPPITLPRLLPPAPSPPGD